MVRTRAQSRRYREFNIPDEDRDEPPSQTEETNGNDYEYDAGDQDEEECESCAENERLFNANYRDNDTCKRHRKRDDSAYSVDVNTYKRRRPIR